MSDDSTDSQQPTLGQRLKHGVESKILVPVAAGLVTIGVKYLLKKLPMILEEKVLPKLAEKGAPAKVTQAVEGTAAKLGDADADGDGAGHADDAADQQESASADTSDASDTADTSDTSDTDREAERRKREQRRQERKRALDKVA